MNPLLIELTRIETETALPELLTKVVAVLQERLQYHKYDAFDVATAVSEVCQNIFDHNEGAYGFLAMQVYGRGQFLEIAIGDCGCGLLTTLSRNSRHSAIRTDLAAIRLATQAGTSEYEDATRGTGLYHLLEIAYKHRGAVQIRSGSAKMRYRMDKRRGWEFRVSQMPGVQISLTLPSKAAA
jgi:hypothetical protein